MKIVFMGTPLAAAVSLQRLLDAGHEVVAVYTQPDRPSGRGHKVSYSAVKRLALDKGLNIYQPTKVRTQEAAEEFRSHHADAAVVVAYGRILPAEFITAYPHGAINVHFSILPKYRGAAPVNWAIVNGEAVTGVTTMKMDEGLDTGPILLQRGTSIGIAETAPELMDRLAVIGADLLDETLSGLETIVPQPQDEAAASYAPILTREDGLIDWSSVATSIVDRIRGFQPFPGSYTFNNGAKLTFWRASSAPRSTSNAALGEVIEASGDVLKIVCGNGSVLVVHEIQPEGKRRMSVRDFLNGSKLGVGAVLGK